MTTCVPIRDLKDTAKFAALVEASDEPVTVTRNGREVFVVMSAADYAAMGDEVARAKLLARILMAEDELAAGDYVDGASFTASIRERYGL